MAGTIMAAAPTLPTTVGDVPESARGAWDGVVASLLRVGVLAVCVIAGKLLRPLVRARLARTRTPSFTRVFARVTSTAATLTGVLLATTIVFPSVRPVDILSGAGVLMIAAGFAFQDILQNLLAGLLLLSASPSAATTRSGSTT